MFAAENLGVAQGGDFLFRHVSFQISVGERVALTGPNGAGKTTLFRVISGYIAPIEGHLTYPRNSRISMLGQELPQEINHTVKDYVGFAFQEINELKRKIINYYKTLENLITLEEEKLLDLVAKLNEAEARLKFLNMENHEEKIQKTLEGLGFNPKFLHEPMNHLSGGWQMRAELARLILSNPDLLLLDEPTNHLDIESIIWLEDFLRTYPGTIIIILHDREFLDNATHRTLELANGKLSDYPFSYSKFEEARLKSKINLDIIRKNHEKERKRIQENIDRFRYKANKASFAQSLIKRLNRMEIVENDENSPEFIHFRFPQASRSGVLVVEGLAVSKTFGIKKVLHSLDFQISRGEKIAFIGSNGMGKTTLARILAGDLTCQGELKFGHNVQVGFYAQHVTSTLDPSKTVLQELENTAAPYDSFTQVRKILGAFLFKGDSVHKKISVLSGGEKARLALAKLLVQPFNFLILDEPTNHLDMRSKEILKEALLNFNGTLVVVSHDRSFLSGLCHKTWEFTLNGIKMHWEGVEEVLAKRKFNSLREYAQNLSIAQANSESTIETPSGKSNRLKQNEIRKIKSVIEKQEKAIETIEKELLKLESILSNPDSVLNLDGQIYSQYEKLKSNLSVAYNDWEKACIDLDNLENS